MYVRPTRNAYAKGDTEKQQNVQKEKGVRPDGKQKGQRSDCFEQGFSCYYRHAPSIHGIILPV